VSDLQVQNRLIATAEMSKILAAEAEAKLTA
jgi:hypothetical protein